MQYLCDSLATAGQQKNHSLLNHLTCLVVTSRCSGLDNYFAKSTHLSGPFCLCSMYISWKKLNRIELRTTSLALEIFSLPTELGFFGSLVFLPVDLIYAFLNLSGTSRLIKEVSTSNSSNMK